LLCGISDAIQHYYGIRNARCIVAINPDPTAPIFKVADLGLVGEVKDIIPAVLKELGAR
jgi:electron transfer flavoprotein alpha subunit